MKQMRGWIAMGMALLAGWASANIIYSNSFTGVAGGDPGLSAEVDPGLSYFKNQMELDGDGRLVSTATIAGSAFYAQLSETPLTAPEIKLSWTMRATSESRWVGVGFHGEPFHRFQDDEPNGGPWLLITNTGTRLKGGTSATKGTDELLRNTHEAGDLLAFEMSYYPSTQTVDVWLNGDLLFDGFEIEHEYPAGTPSAPSIRFVQAQIWQESLDDTAAFENLVVEAIPEPDPEGFPIHLAGIHEMEAAVVSTVGISLTNTVPNEFILEYTPGLTNPTWLPVATNQLQAPEGELVHTNLSLDASAFYRVRRELEID